MVPDDSLGLVTLAHQWGQPFWTISPDAHGVVVRDGDEVVAFCLIRETPHGFLLDELREEKSRRGIRALSLLADWVEDKMGDVARERGTPISLGGIVTLRNASHKGALVGRGYEVVAEVLAKDFQP